MARKGTIAFAEKTLTPEEFAAWLALPVKLSKKQLETGEKPPKAGKPHLKLEREPDAPESRPDAPESRLDRQRDLIGEITQAAMNHGADEGNPDDEIGDLQAALSVLWECMGAKAREKACANEELSDFLEEWSGEDDDEEEEEEDDDLEDGAEGGDDDPGEEEENDEDDET